MTAALSLPPAVSALLHLLRRDGGTQARAAMCEATVEEYIEKIDELPPVVVFRDADGVFWLADGFHRVEAHHRTGRDMLLAHVVEGSRRDAMLYACGANAHHGLPRSHDDKRRAVTILLEDDEWASWADAEIANACRVDRKFVRTMRDRLGIHATERTYQRAGQTQTMSVPPRDGQPGTSHVGAGTSDTFQAPEPDNTVRTPVEREHKGRELSAGDHEAMRALRDWPREKLAERFRVDLAEVDRILGLEVAVADGPPARAEALSQFFTPPWLAKRMVELADLRAGDSVLEPSGGRGALVRAILEAHPRAGVVVHELDPRMVAELRTIEGGVQVIEGSYLDDDEGFAPYAVAVMNPPYENGLDGLFLAKACAESCSVVALVRANIFYGSRRHASVWSQYGKHLTAVRHIVARPDFTEGTPDVHGAMSDFVVIRLDDLDEEAGDELARPTVDWWLEPEDGGAA